MGGIQCRFWYLMNCISVLQIYISTKWGFTKWERDEFEVLRANGTLVPDGVSVQYRRAHGPLAFWMKERS